MYLGYVILGCDTGPSTWNVIKAALFSETSVFTDKCTLGQKALHTTPEFSELLEFQLNTTLNSNNSHQILTKCDSIYVTIQTVE